MLYKLSDHLIQVVFFYPKPESYVMEIIKKVKINLINRSSIKRVYLFGRAIYQYSKQNGKKKRQWVKSIRPSSQQRVFYLKVHRVHSTSFLCIQHWLDIAHELNAFCYFVCDNKEMEIAIYEKNLFHNDRFRFISSDQKTLKPVIEKLLHDGEDKWKRIAAAMLTPFVHADEHNYCSSYNIDADDIEILLRPELIAKAFIKAENYATENNLNCFNLDMFVSKTFGVHWSFGVVYVRTPKTCLEVIKNNTNWRENKKLIKKHQIDYLDEFWFNVDWLFTFLRDTKQLKLETFYIEKAYVVHMPDIILEHEWAFFFQWNNQKINHPVLLDLYNDQRWGALPIAPCVVKIDINLSEKDLHNFMNEFYFVDSKFRTSCLKSAKNRKLISPSLYEYYLNAPMHKITK